MGARSGAEWATMNEFFHMGGYGAYVWSAYGLSIVAGPDPFTERAPVFAARKRNLNVKKEIKKLGSVMQ